MTEVKKVIRIYVQIKIVMLKTDVDFSPTGEVVALLLLDKVSKEPVLEQLEEIEDVNEIKSIESEEKLEELKEFFEMSEQQKNTKLVKSISTIREHRGESGVEELIGKTAKFIESYIDEEGNERVPKFKSIEEDLTEELERIKEK